MANFGLLALNKTTTGDDDALLGEEYEVEDIDYSDTAQAPSYPKLSNSMIHVQRVRASETITAAQAVVWTAGYRGKRVSVAGDGDIPCGVMTPYVSTVASGTHFLIIRKGPGKVESAGGASFAEGNIAVTAAAGQVDEQTAAPADTTAAMVQVKSRVGRLMADVAAVAGTKVRAWIDCTSN